MAIPGRSFQLMKPAKFNRVPRKMAGRLLLMPVTALKRTRAGNRMGKKEMWYLLKKTE